MTTAARLLAALDGESSDNLGEVLLAWSESEPDIEARVRTARERGYWRWAPHPDPAARDAGVEVVALTPLGSDLVAGRLSHHPDANPGDCPACDGTGWVTPPGCNGVRAASIAGLGVHHFRHESCPVHEAVQGAGIAEEVAAQAARVAGATPPPQPAPVEGARMATGREARPGEQEAVADLNRSGPPRLDAEPVEVPADMAERLHMTAVGLARFWHCSVAEATERLAAVLTPGGQEALASYVVTQAEEPDHREEEPDPVVDLLADLLTHDDTLTGTIVHTYSSAHAEGRRAEVVLRLSLPDGAALPDLTPWRGRVARLITDRAIVDATVEGPGIPDGYDDVPLDPSIVASIDAQTTSFLTAIAHFGPEDVDTPTKVRIALAHFLGSVTRVVGASLTEHRLIEAEAAYREAVATEAAAEYGGTGGEQ